MYYLGIDSGGTKTAAVLFEADSGTVHAVSVPGGNICVLGKSGCKTLLKNIIRRFPAGVLPAEIAGSTFAFAGAGRPAERALLESLVQETGFRNFRIMTDAEILHYSFFGDAPGILIASGTGSVCLVNTPDGQYRQIGGWGSILGDEGSGFHIGKLAFAHALHAMETGRERTPLTEALLRFYDAGHPKELISRTYASEGPSRFIAACASEVIRLAEGGDADANSVVDTACGALVQLAQSAIRCYTGSGIRTFRIALAGGVLCGDSWVGRKFKQGLGQAEGTIEYPAQQYSPAAAAVMHAMPCCGRHPSQQDKHILSNLEFIDTEPSICESSL